jgi:hypothetical protein
VRRVEGDVCIPRVNLPLAAACLAGVCLAGVCLAGLAAACAGPHTADDFPATGPAAVRPAAEGTLAGHLYGVGGVAPGAPRPWPGTVTLTSPGVHRDVQVSATGRYSVLVPAGTYALAGRSPLYQSGTGVCRAAGPATVTTGHRTEADVLCQLK